MYSNINYLWYTCICCSNPLPPHRGSSEHNPNVSGKDSTSSMASEDGSSSSSDWSDIDGEIILDNDADSKAKDSGSNLVSLKVQSYDFLD